MSGNLRSEYLIDVSNAIASMQSVGKVTETESQKMQRVLKNINTQLNDMSRYGKEASNSTATMAKSAANMEHFGFQTAAAKRELLVLAHELSQGNYSRFGGSLMVLAERTNAMEVAFSSAGLAIGVATLLVGGFVTAAIMGHLEAEKFANSLTATGNAAGMTASSFNSLSAYATQFSGETIGKSKDALQALVETGRFYPEVIGIATQASLNLQRVTGITSDEAAKEFAKMADGVAKWAAEYNKHAHFISVAQFKHIKELEDAGKKEDAARETLKLLNAQLSRQAEDLEAAAGWWDKLKRSISGAVDAMKQAGAPLDAAAELASLRGRLQVAEAGTAGDRFYGADGKQVAGKKSAIESIQARIETLRELVRMQERAAGQAAVLARVNEAGIHAITNPGKVKDKESHDPLETRNTAFRQSELGAEAATNQALREEQLKRYMDLVKKDGELATFIDVQLSKQAQRDLERNKSFDEHLGESISKYVNGAADQSKRAEQLVSGSFLRMEDAIINFAKTGKLSLSDLFGFMAEEYLRNVIHMSMQKNLLDSGGGFAGIGAIFSAATNFLGGFMPHANGLDYVPYNGYRALLHEGERVQTRQEVQGAARSASGGNITITHGDLHVGEGVSRGEVAAALKIQQASTVEIIRRRDRTGKWS